MTSHISRPARVGLITDQTGALSFMGIANVNLAKMVTDDINARGGLLGRPVELYVEDSATNDHVAHTAAARLVREADVDVVVGGIYSSTRQAIKGPVVDEAAKLYVYPEQYEGQECHPLIFCTGPVPAQQLDPFIPWLMKETGARRFYMPSADYIWPHVMNERVREPRRGGPHVRGDRQRAVHLGPDRRAPHPEHLHQDRRVEPRRRHALGHGAPRRGRRPRRLTGRLVKPVWRWRAEHGPCSPRLGRARDGSAAVS
jgi:Periplasmic binding protein domain